METERTPERLIEVLRSVNGRAVFHCGANPSDYIEGLCREAADAIEKLLANIETIDQLRARERGREVDIPDCDDPDKVQTIIGEKVLASPEEMASALRSLRMAAGTPVAELCRNAAALIEKLQEELRDGGEVRVLVSGTIGFNGAKAITVERLQEVFMAFAKFDGNDWDFLLGLRRYSPHGVTLAYRGDGRGGRERQMQEALTILRAAVEETKPEEPSEAAKAFVSQWGSGTADYRHQMAIAFDKAVGR